MYVSKNPKIICQTIIQLLPSAKPIYEHRTDEHNLYRQPDSPYDVRECGRDKISKIWPT